MQLILSSLIYFPIIWTFVIVSIQGQNKNLNERLTNALLEKTKSKMRPIEHPSEKLNVWVIGALYQIVDVDQRNNLATISAYFDMQWIDPKLAWEPAKYNGTMETYVPSAKIWVPELYLYHSVQGSTPLVVQEAAARVLHNGTVRIFVPFTARALCPINVKHFPFDTQTCNFTFGSWSYKLESLEYFPADSEVFLGDFYDNQEWLLRGTRFIKSISNYRTSFHNESFSTVVMELELERQAFYYLFNLGIPVTLVSIVSVIGLHAPANSSPRRESKYRLGIMTLLSMGVMLLMVVDEMPKFALTSIPGQRGSFSDVPLLGIYYISLICTVSLCTCSTSIFVIMERYALEKPEYHFIPWFLRWLVFEWPCCNGNKANKNSTVEKRAENPKEIEAQTLLTSLDATADKTIPNSISHEKSGNAAANDINYSCSELSYIKPKPLSKSQSSGFPRFTGFIGREHYEYFAQLLEKIHDNLSIISQQLLQLQAKVTSPAQSFSGNIEDLRYKGKGKGGKKSRRALSGGANDTILSHEWHQVISRLELISLALYTCVICTAIFLLFQKEWY